MMKGVNYFHERSRTKKQLSLFFFIGVVAVFTTILVWSWEKAPLLTSLFPSHSQLLQLFPAGDVKVKHVTQSKDDDSRQSQGVATILPPLSTSKNASSLHTQGNDPVVSILPPSTPNNTSFFHTRGNDGVVDLVSPIKAPSLDIRGDAYPTKAQEKLHENSTDIGKKQVSSEVSENYNDSKPPKQQLAEPMPPPKKRDSPVEREGDGVSLSNMEKLACNFGKGRWVKNDSRPLYSGFGCKQWLSGMWACRLTQRTDFGYEKLKWEPKDCKMDDFTGPNFLKRMQDKALAFIGDSLGRQQFQSLMCMITGGEERHDVEDVGKKYGLVKARGSVRPDGWAYRFPITNTTILYYWSASLCELDPIDPINGTTYYAMHLDRPPTFLQRYISRFSVVVLNTGHHWNRGKLNANRWVMYVDGKRNTNKRIAEINRAKNLTIHSIIKWVNGELPKYPGLKAFYRSISPRHFFNGDWNSGGTCDSTTPGALEVVQDESSDSIASGAVKGTDVKLLDITALSQVRDEGHISRYSIRATPGAQDCLHWCLPGIPDTWNELLFAQI